MSENTEWTEFLYDVSSMLESSSLEKDLIQEGDSEVDDD